jgi:hypothetical protein
MNRLTLINDLLSKLERDFELWQFEAISGIPEADLKLIFSYLSERGIVVENKSGRWQRV